MSKHQIDKHLQSGHGTGGASSVDRPPTTQNLEQQKAAADNVRQGYGSTVKSRLMSAKPDGDVQGGPGANNENANPPAKP